MGKLVTPDILPGEPGYISKKERTKALKVKEKRDRTKALKKELTIGKIRPGRFKIGRPIITPRGEKKYPIWRFSKNIGEIIVRDRDKPTESIEMSYNRFGGVGNYKHLIQDADFQLEWATREQELLMTQGTCYICKKKLNKSGEPNLYHFNMWKYRAKLMEEAEKVPSLVVEGKITIEDGWDKFNDILEEGNRYYMSLKDTALVCATCAKNKGLQF